MRGISDATAYVDEPGDLCAPDAMRNAWPYDVGEDRHRIGQRPSVRSKFVNPDGTPWKAPSYIQGFGQVNIAESTIFVPGSQTYDIFDDENGGGGTIYATFPNDFTSLLIDNQNYGGSQTDPPRIKDEEDYVSQFGDFESTTEGSPSSLSSPEGRWDKFAASGDGGASYEDELHVSVYNYYQTADTKTVRRCRLVAQRKNSSTGRWDIVNEYEISDADSTSGVSRTAGTTAPTNGNMDFHVAGDTAAFWHVSANALDIGADYIYVALYTYTTSDNNHDGTVTQQRGWVLALPKSDMDYGTSPTYAAHAKDDCGEWAVECTSVRYRQAFTQQTIGDTTYGTPDVLVLFAGYYDYQSGIARYEPNLSARRRIGEIPWYGNPGHGGLFAATISGGVSTDPDASQRAKDDLIDQDHGCCRFSVVSSLQRGPIQAAAGITNDTETRWTHGCYPIAMDVDAAGLIYVARTTIGWGIPDISGDAYQAGNYSGGNLPDENIPKVTVMVLNQSGGLRYEALTDHILPANGYSTSGSPVYGPYYNDRYFPTLINITADAGGRCMVVGRWAGGANCWHVTQSGQYLGTADWKYGIGLASGTVEDDLDATTRQDRWDPNRTIGLAELTMYSVAYDATGGRYLVTGEEFRPFENGTLAGGTPALGTWRVEGAVPQAKAAKIGPGQIWSLRRSGASASVEWKRYLDASVDGLHVETQYLDDEGGGAGSFIMFTHEAVDSTSRDTTPTTSSTTNTGWNWAADRQYWWLSNPSPDNVPWAMIATRKRRSSFEAVMTVTNYETEIAVLIKGSTDGRNGWLVRTYNDGAWKLVIDKLTDGVPAVSYLDSETLANLNLTTADTQYQIRVRVTSDDQVEAYVSTQTDPDTPAVSGTLTDYLENDRVGFWADFTTYDALGRQSFGDEVENVRVTGFELRSLASVVQSQASILCIMSAGRLFVVRDGETVEEIVGLDMRDDFLIDATQFQQRLYLVDGENIRRYNPTENDPNDAITAFAPSTSAADLPGYTGAGVTTAKNIATHLNRLWLWGMDEDSQNIVACAFADPEDWDTSSTDELAAISLSNELAGVVGVPIIDFVPHRDDAAVIACQERVELVYGDPGLEFSRQDVVTLDVGVENVGSIAFGDQGQAWIQTEQGCAVLQDRVVTVFSKERLTKYADPDTHTFETHNLVIRDPEHYGVWFFFTAVNSDEATIEDAGYFNSAETFDGTPITSVHLFYSERAKGFFPIYLPSGADPTAVFSFRGQVLIGGRDGYVRILDNSDPDDWGTDGVETAIEFNCPSSLVTHYEFDTAMKLISTTVVLSSGRDGCTMYMQQADTAEDARKLARDSGLHTVALTAGRNIIRKRVVGAAVQLMFLNDTLGESPVIEGVSVKMVPAGTARTPKADVAITVPADSNIGPCIPGGGGGGGGGPTYPSLDDGNAGGNTDPDRDSTGDPPIGDPPYTE